MAGRTPHHGRHRSVPTDSDLPADPHMTDKLIDFTAERGKRIHDLHEKRLIEVREAFEQALPLPKTKKPKGTPKKR